MKHSTGMPGNPANKEDDRRHTDCEMPTNRVLGIVCVWPLVHRVDSRP